MKRKRKKNIKMQVLVPLILLGLVSFSYYFEDDIQTFFGNFTVETSYAMSEIPEYTGEDYVVIEDRKSVV